MEKTLSKPPVPTVAHYILLILTPVALLLVAAAVQVMVHYVINLGHSSNDLAIFILNIFSVICGLSGIVTILLTPLWVIRLVRRSHQA